MGIKSNKKCTKGCGIKKLMWDGNPDGIIAFECPVCGEYEYDGKIFKNYTAAQKNYEEENKE